MINANVIKYEGDNATFVWKHPTEDFNTGSQLIVHESQEAVFFLNGQALDLFGPGRYALETENLPFLSRLFNRVTGDKTPFHCEVYFVNKAEQPAITWGTDSRVEYVEPRYGFPLQIGARGEMSLRAEDSRKLLVKLVGTEADLTQDMLVKKLRMFLNARIKPYLVRLIKSEKINIFEIDEHLTAMSEALHGMLRSDFADYGLALERFFVIGVVKPEEDAAYKKFKELHFRQYADVADAEIRRRVTVIDAQARAEKRATEGYTYQEERGLDVAEKVASNEAVGQMTNVGVGLGMIGGVGGAIGGAVGGAVQNAMKPIVGAPVGQAGPAPVGKQCANCGAVVPIAAKFCPECGVSLGDDRPIVTKCPECGADVAPNGKFCTQCGHKI
ncbi:MAG: SPFH domain-containing protein [Synergistaceae bacterium]|jgi:membrane protease subunit (stomatin/prohibitin family)|nr:SPFH domain-containing protein [Synergistaceae bacterium]